MKIWVALLLILGILGYFWYTKNFSFSFEITVDYMRCLNNEGVSIPWKVRDGRIYIRPSDEHYLIAACT
ncbi:hypothetical protein DC3_39570 [Deinococcus cellulosilyticus NBRC 106333 = KACC 11606]|uniref:Uncharacterized protein n=1 Tax=Deinococcus cellulosilyticus (strain DSM 18568 / NBRC 106333 / KACC 11606 / 5516J-15) TaxID=1223518 RepID=A0A511N629_DEIC1|nr:hypothetical protein DC3_39570 [Deinococcus cellulosilyticus NBRC 106333 = KACC 11606]